MGLVGDDKDPQYVVRSKEYGVIEFSNSSLYFVRDWAKQMAKALDDQDAEITAETEVKPGANVVQFPGGDGGRTN